VCVRACAQTIRSVRGRITKGTDNRNKGTENRKQGINNCNQGTDNRNQGINNRNQGINNRNQGINNRNQGADYSCKAYLPAFAEHGPHDVLGSVESALTAARPSRLSANERRLLC
jgi:hypothetical protein